MILKPFLLIFLSLLLTKIHAQLPETDIYLCTIKKEGENLKFSKPENITNRPGYENQPYFTPDGNKILYVVADSAQSDVYSYNIKAKINQQVTETKESEYSPAYTPDRKFVSVVRVDADSGQRFYKMPINNFHNAIHVKNTDSIGYSCWLNDSMLAMFILGPANTLQILNTHTSERKLIASDIGRCLKMSPDKSEMYFVIKSNPEEWFIYSLSCSNFSLKRIIRTMPKSEDFAVFPDGRIALGSEGKLFFLQGKEWQLAADFSNDIKNFYRITVNNDGTLLALVGFTGAKP